MQPAAAVLPANKSRARGGSGREEAHPQSARPRRVTGVRELAIRPYYPVVYTEDTEKALILRVLHAAQMWP